MTLLDPAARSEQMFRPHELTTMASLLDEAAGHLRAFMESELAEQRQVRHFLPDELEGSAIMLRDAAGATTVREGWRLVPLEPTPEMAAEGQHWVAEGWDWPKAVYRAMVKVAPIPAARVEPIPGGVAIQKIRDLAEIQEREAASGDVYMVGLFNGLELALATLENRDPKYRSVSLPSSTPGLDPNPSIADWLRQRRDYCLQQAKQTLDGRIRAIWISDVDCFDRALRDHTAGSGLDPIRSSDGEELEPVSKPQDPYGY